MSETNWMNDAAGRIFTYAFEWNEGRKIWRDEDIVNIIKHASAPEVITGGCICGHGFSDHEHPAAPWMAINGKMLNTKLGACKLCDCRLWREPESLMDNDEEGGASE